MKFQSNYRSATHSYRENPEEATHHLKSKWNEWTDWNCFLQRRLTDQTVISSSQFFCSHKTPVEEAKLWRVCDTWRSVVNIFCWEEKENLRRGVSIVVCGLDGCLADLVREFRLILRSRKLMVVIRTIWKQLYLINYVSKSLVKTRTAEIAMKKHKAIDNVENVRWFHWCRYIQVIWKIFYFSEALFSFIRLSL